MGNSTQFLQLKKKKNARGIQETEGESTDEDRREKPTNQPQCMGLIWRLI